MKLGIVIRASLATFTEKCHSYKMKVFILLHISPSFTFTFNSVRKFRKKSSLGSSGKWEYEIGEGSNMPNLEELSIRESNTAVSTIIVASLAIIALQTIDLRDY